MKYRICLLAMLANLYPVAYAESHQSGEIDTSEIQVLDQLESLKNPEPLSMTLPNIQHFSTENGTKVQFVQTPNLPMVDIGIYFNAGSARDEAVKPQGYGISSLTASLLKKGTASKTEDQIAEMSEELGISLSANAYKDMFIVSLRSLSDEKLDKSVDLLQDILSNPTFPANALARTKAQYMLGIERQKEDPASIADIAFDKHLYGNHPYAHPTIGTQSSIPEIVSEDLTKFWQTFLVANNANIAITGNISLEKAKQIANILTKNLPVGEKAPTLPDAKPLTAQKRIHIPFDSTQTSIIMGQIGTKRATDAKTLQQQMNFNIANDVVGGGNFQAYLMQEIRKKRGLTYGIYAQMTPMQAQGSYQISLSTRNDKAQEAIDETLKILNKTRKTGILQSELDLTKENFLNSFPLSFASNASINSTIGMMGFYGLPDDYLQNYQGRIDKANLIDVNQTFKNTIEPNHFLIITVGNDSKD